MNWATGQDVVSSTPSCLRVDSAPDIEVCPLEIIPIMSHLALLCETSQMSKFVRYRNNSFSPVTCNS